MNEHKHRKKEFYFGSFTITVREILASSSIIAVMLLIGVLISEKISEYQMDKNEVYNKATKIENNTELFQYGMNTNIGNAFVYGDLEAVDTVTYPEIGGEYMYVEKVKERYTQHTRQVAHTRTVNGKTQTYYTTETYWEWDRVGTESITCKGIKFCGVYFNSSKITFPGANYITTIKESSHVRYKYYGTDIKFTGTIFTDLRNQTIPDHTNFYNDMSIDETLESLQSSGAEIIFWVFWIILICVCTFGFYYLDNKWLEG